MTAAERNSGIIIINGEVFFDTTICRDYPVWGYVTAIHQSGAEEVITFSGSCDGTYNREMRSAGG